MAVHSAAMASATSSPHPNQGQPNQTSSLDFDLSEFSLHSSMDDLGLFAPNAEADPINLERAGQSSANQSSPNGARTQSLAQSQGVHGSPDPHSHQQHHQQAHQHPQPNQSGGSHPLSSVYAAGEPAADHQQQQSNTQQQQGSESEASASDLSQLLSAIQGGLLSQQQPRTASGPINNQQVSLQDIQRMLAEKEQSDRLQNLQTALLRQQLEALQRAQANPQRMQHLPSQQQKDLQGSAPSVQQLLSALQAGQPLGNFNASGQNTSQLGPEAQQLLSGLLGGSVQAPLSNTGETPYSLPKLLADPNVLAQYGILTPPASGAFNSAGPGANMNRAGGTTSQPFMSPLNIPGVNHSAGPSSSGTTSADSRPWEARHSFTPLESPAVTPASVFSNMSLGASTDQFFSPLTSPALHPQPNYYPPSGGFAKPHKPKSTTPLASPLALTGKPGPLPRKNRSTTAEARANRSRPSPLIKPTTGSSKRKKDNPSASSVHASPSILPGPSGQSSRRQSTNEQGRARSISQPSQPNGAGAGDANNLANYSVSAFTPLMAGSAKPMDASPSEGAASTPSPIDLSSTVGDNSKPLTPGSIMGIGQVQGDALTKRNTSRNRSESKSGSASSDVSANGKSNAKGKGKANSVTFAASARDDDEDEEGGSPTNGNGAESGANAGGPPDSRRTSHKAAEQKRRDSLKYCFDELRGMLPPITLDEDAPGGSYLGPDGLTEDEEAEGFDRADVMDPEYSKTANRAISKVALLRHSNEWIIRLRNRLARRDAALGAARAEVDQLRTLLLANGIIPPAPLYTQMQQSQYQARQQPHQMLLHHQHPGLGVGGDPAGGMQQHQNFQQQQQPQHLQQQQQHFPQHASHQLDQNGAPLMDWS